MLNLLSNEDRKLALSKIAQLDGVPLLLRPVVYRRVG
jgi:hypothetical protein